MNLKEKLGLLGATILTFGIGTSMPAAAQTAANQAAEEEDVIVVTGSRIRRETFDSPNPTFQVGAQEMEERQFTNTVDALEDLPFVGIGVNNQGANTQFGDNFAFVDLLDLGTQRTLTLLNGRRVVAGNQGTVFVPGNASGAQVDLSIINPALIERTEIAVATGGAVYGADAVAGVVNIITRDDFEGLDLRAQAGVTELGDGESFRVSGLWGGNFFNDRANLVVSGEYFKQDLITTSTETASRYQGSPILNTLDGARNTSITSAALSAAILAGTAPPSFQSLGSDGVPSVFYGPLSLQNPRISEGGVLMTNQFLSGFNANSHYFQHSPVGAALAGFGLGPSGLPILAPSTLGAMTAAQVFAAYGTPGAEFAGMTVSQQNAFALQLLQRNQPTVYEYALANPGLNPLLFVGTFGPGSAAGLYPVINNTDVATMGLFPRIAVPLQFDSSGNLVAFNIGDIRPPSQVRVGSAFGGDGYDSFASGHQQVQSGVERMSFSAFGGFDINDYIRAKTELLYSDITFDSIGAAQQNSSTGSTAAGTRSIPIFYNQNPLLTAASLNTINTQLIGNGYAPQTIGGQNVLFMGRALTDITGGGSQTTNEVQTFRVAQIFEGEFELLNRPFYWDLSGAFGRVEASNSSEQILDLEFALAVDVVAGPGGSPVCHQQTLGAPQAVNIRNPQLSFINTTLGLTPTAAQVAACVPLNLFGNGAPSQAAIDYVTADGGTTNTNEQTYYAFNIGTELWQLPAGPISVAGGVEWRQETIAFVAKEASRVGATRNTTILSNTGELEFLEYGGEVLVPIFGDGFQFPGMNTLELNYAFRIVERSQTTASPFYPDPGDAKEDDTFSYGFRWRPVEDLTIRGSRARSVRSASLVELFSAPGAGFTNPAAGANPCITTSIDTGPNPAVRRANCITAAIATGVAANAGAATTFLSTFTGTGGSRPAAATGNPFLNNEEGNSYNYGITWEPSFIPRLVLAADFVAIDLTGELALYAPANYMLDCFDSPAFPNATIAGGLPVCDIWTFAQPGPGGFVIPAINPLTGSPVGGGAPIGAPSVVQGPTGAFETAFFQFPNLNIGATEVRGVNWEVRYNFPLENLFGDMASNWGDLFIRTSLFHSQRLDRSGNGTFSDRNKSVGEHTNPEYEFRTDFNHRVGPFTQTLQWFRNSGTVTNIQTPKEQYIEQNPNFVGDDFDFFNYIAGWDFNDNITFRLVVNNLTDTEEPRGQYGATNPFDNGLGREFIFGVSARF